MMDKKKVFCIGAGILVMGSLSWAASSTPQANAAAARRATAMPAGRNAPVMPVAAPAPAAVQPGALALVPPPAELPRAGSGAMVTSVKPMAPAVAATMAPTAKTTVTKNGKPAARPAAMAAARKPGRLFSYVRMLNYSPHPTDEEFLRDKPLALNGHNYWLKVSYREGWDVDEEENGNLKNIAFDIKLMEGDAVVRNLRIPAVNIEAGKLRKGLVLGLAEVAPYKFHIAVDSFRVTDGGVSELVFKFDLTG